MADVSRGRAGARPVCLEVAVGGAEADEAAAVLWSAGATAVQEQDDRLLAGFDSEHGAARAVASLAGRWASRPVRVDDSWSVAWRAYSTPVAVGRLWVRPAWVSAEPPAGAVEVVLDPGGAYGDGSHPSTRMALEAVESRVRSGQRVLDLGCGSGVVAVAAARLGAAPVIAIDIDPAAAAVTAANARRNRAEVKVVAGTVDCLTPGHPYDLVVANLGGLRAVRHVLDSVAARLTAAGVVVVSGLVGDQAERLAALASGLAAPAGPMVEVGRRVIDSWGCLCLQRPA